MITVQNHASCKYFTWDLDLKAFPGSLKCYRCPHTGELVAPHFTDLCEDYDEDR